MYDQLYEYFEKVLSSKQYGFRKGYSAPNYLLVMIEKWRDSLDKGEFSGAIMTDLSKACDCLSHDLKILIVFLKFINSYLSNRKQRTKVNNSYSSYSKIDFGVPQGSILGPFLFNIYICDMFYLKSECNIVSYADNTTPYTNN